MARAAWAFVTPALVLLIYVLGKPVRSRHLCAPRAATPAPACYAGDTQLTRVHPLLPDILVARSQVLVLACPGAGARAPGCVLARRRHARAALTHSRSLRAASGLSSPRVTARDAPSALSALHVSSDAVPSEPGPFKPEDYVLSPALVRVRLCARSPGTARGPETAMCAINAAALCCSERHPRHVGQRPLLRLCDELGDQFAARERDELHGRRHGRRPASPSHR